MSNTIKLKRGSGSDPQASDLSVGELAIRTDSGKIFTKKDNGSVAEISGGGGIDDGDKGDITVSNGGDTFTIDSGVVTASKLASNAVTSAKIADGAVTVTKLDTSSVNASKLTVNSVTSEKIANSNVTTTKIADDAVTYAKIQNVSATNRILGRDSSGAGVIEEITPANLRTMINVEDGATADQSNSEIKTAYEANSNTNAFTDALLSKLNGIAASATNVTNNNQLTNGAGYITATLTNEQVQDIVGGMVSSNTESGITVTYQDGDGTLDFSVASQTDNNFTNALLNKLNNIEAGATADQSASQIKSSYESNSDTNAFTDALLSKLNGIASGATNVTNTNQLTNGAGFITATLTNEQVQDIVGGMVSGNTESGITVTYQDGDGTLDFSVASQTDNNFTNADHSKLDGIEAGATADQTASEILTLLKTVDGSGSGLDADTLDGISSGSFLRSDQADTFSDNLTIDGRLDVGNGSGNDTEIRIYKADNNVSDHIQFYNGTTRIGEIGCEDSTWLRINQETAKNIYTPRYIRADNGFFVDGTSKGINGSGNFIGGTIAGASDVSVAASSSTIVQRHASGYIFSNFINTTDNDVSTGVSAVMVKTSDDYHRSGTAAAIRTFLNVEDGATAGGGGATGGGSDEVFYENGQTVTTSYTITNGKNAMAAGPIVVQSGATVTVGSGETLTIV